MGFSSNLNKNRPEFCVPLADAMMYDTKGMKELKVDDHCALAAGAESIW